MSAKSILALMTAALLCACQNNADSGPQPAASEEDMAVKTSGLSSCRAGAPGHGYQVAANADVPPGQSATLTLNIPASQRSLFSPVTAILRCQVDLQWCGGASCGGKPPVDFYGDHSNGLTWEATTKGEVQTVTFTAIAHNADKETHAIRLVLEMPDSWRPLDADRAKAQ